MRTPAQIAGHPIHPMLVTIPIGLWLFSLVCDLVALRSDAPDTWVAASLYAMVGGILGALAAALPGLVYLLSLRRTPILPTAVKHMALNLGVVALYIVNVSMRWDDAAPGGAPLLLSVVAIGMLLVSGWLGGKMVYEHGVAVHADEAAAPATHDRRWDDRAAAARGRSTWSPNPEHATASDATRPARSTQREDKPSAVRDPRADLGK